MNTDAAGMDRTEIKRAYIASAAVAGGIVAAIVLYTVIVEVLVKMGHTPVLAPPASYAVKYALYLISVSAPFTLKFLEARLGGRKSSAGEALSALRGLAIVKAAVCELPAVAGLILFLLTGYRADFYMLAVFALALEIWHFPRLSRWEERLRGGFGRP